MKTMRARRKNAEVDKAALDAAFSRDVKVRDGFVCRMEVWNGKRYVEHRIKGSPLNPLDASHIYKRIDCAGLWCDPIVALASCRDCHDKYGDRDDSVRVPPNREEAAFKAIVAVSKSKPVRRTPPNRCGKTGKASVASVRA